MSWRCGVCDGVNESGETCRICGASRAAALPVDPPVVRPAPPPRPTRVPDPTPPLDLNRTRVPDAAPSLEPERPRGLLHRLVDSAARAIERALTARSPSREPAPDADAGRPRRRRRSRMKVRPFPFGVVVTWENDPDTDAR